MNRLFLACQSYFVISLHTLKEYADFKFFLALRQHNYKRELDKRAKYDSPLGTIREGCQQCHHGDAACWRRCSGDGPTQWHHAAIRPQRELITEGLSSFIDLIFYKGLGTYYVRASVPSPAINVMCAHMSHDDMVPMVFTEWPSEYRNGTSVNATNWPDDYNLTTPSSLTYTVVDDLFGFDDTETHPIFSNFPQPYNTVLNSSRLYGHESIYLLATSKGGTYTMCSLRVAQSPDCFTEYYASMSGGSLTSHCGDQPLAYSKSRPDAPRGFWEKDWKDVAVEWGLGLSLNAGITDGNSAIARLLAQLIPTTSALDPNLPSISEALAVLAGCTLVLSSQDSPFLHCKASMKYLTPYPRLLCKSRNILREQPHFAYPFYSQMFNSIELYIYKWKADSDFPDWNYTTPIVNDPQYQAFNATLQTEEYMSGGQHPWQKIFYVVLAAVFVTNVFCLAYFAINGSHITDFIEPQNLFSLSLNSPPSAVLDGSCGGNLEKKQFKANWRITHDKERNHLYIESSGVHKEVHKRSISQGMDMELERGRIKMMMLGKFGGERRV